MPALTDAEILAALPVEARQKIDTAFEALSQSLPSDKERIILYRVASTLKLNPTDTHFSVMAALHYYLQLYQEIPEKIERASAERQKEFSSSLKNTAAREMALASDAVIGELSRKVADIAQRVAGDAAAAERGKSFYLAVAALAASALIFGGTGYVVRMAADKTSMIVAKNEVTDANARTASAIEKAEKKAASEIEGARKSIGWLGTDEGRLAKQFFDSGAGIIAAKCQGEKWDIKVDKNGQSWCIPKTRPLLGWDNESQYGWKIP